MNHLLNTRKGVGGAEMEEEPTSEILKVRIAKKKEEEKKKAIDHWGVLKHSIKFSMKAMQEADVKEVNISHGMLHLRKLNHDKKLKCVLFMLNKKEYLTTDGQIIRVFLEDGRKKGEYIPEEPMDNIAYCKQTNQYVGWVKDDEELFLMNPDFEIISQSKVPCKINLAKYNASTNEFITIGPGFMVCWAFRYGARHLIPRKMTKIEYKVNDQFKHLVLEETASRQQKCFLSYKNGVVVFNVFEGKQIAKRRDLHEREITALTYFNPLKYLITAAKDGTIKVWDKEWFLKTVFVGHTGGVNLLAVYPEGPQIISASLDCSIRVWNLDSCDEADKIVLDSPVENLGADLNYHVLFTYSSKTVDLWRLNHLYHIHTAIGHRVVSVKQTTQPHFPIRAVVISRDCSVRIISPPNGEVLSTFLLDQGDGIVDSAYAIKEETLFTVKKNGDIIKADTTKNPAKVVAEWECQDPKEACNYLLIYEYVPEFEANAWAAFKRGLATKTIGQEGTQVSNEKTILLGGRKDGHICVYDWDTGEVTFKIDAHGMKGVLSMIGNSKQDQLLSAGLDNIIKVWRLFPFAEEALAPLMSFYSTHTPVHMTMLKTNLCVAFQDHSTATYSIVIYNLKDRTLSMSRKETDRYDHKPDDDHTDTITGLTSCVRMKLYASSSMDGTIRIWNETNTLTRVLKLKTMPYSIGFCSQKGDLLIGVENHLYKIPYYMYLPRAYRVKMVSMKFHDPKSEHALPYDEDTLSELSKYDYTRLKQSHPSFTYDHFEDILTPDEQEEVTREQKIKDAAYEVLKMRETELMNLKNGKISPRFRPRQTPETKKDAFDKYMKMYYDRPRLSIPQDEPYPKDKVEDVLRGPPKKVEIPFTPEREPSGFFPPKSLSARSRASRASSKRSAEGSGGAGAAETPTPLEAPYAPINTDGYVPNSVLTKILWPPPPPKKKKEVTWRPPTFTDDQMLKPPSPEEEEEEDAEEAEDEEPVMVMDWADEEEEKVSVQESPIPEKTPSPPPIKSKEVTFDRKPTVHTFDQEKSISPAAPPKEASSLMSKFKELQAAKPPSPIPKIAPEDDDDTSTMTATPRSLSDFDQGKPVEKEKKPSPIEREMKPKRSPPPKSPIVKEIKPPPKPLEPIAKETPKPKPVPPTEPPPPKPRPTAPPPRPVTPLPQFITQFKGADWFEKYFPDANENNIPKPWTIDNFAVLVSRLLRIAEYIHKISVADALIMIQTQEDLSEASAHQIIKILSAVLNDHKEPPTCMDDKQKSFIVSSLRLLNNLNVRDKEFVTELMVQFLDGDKEVRTTVAEIFQSNSLHDPHKYLQKELDSWDIWNVEDDDRKADLRKMCHQWLDRWMTSYKMHLTDTIEKMKKGQNVHGKMSRGQIHKRSATPTKSILKKGEEDEMHGSSDFVPRAPGGPKSITVTFDKPPDASLVESATYIDAINYFCDMMMSKEMDHARRAPRKMAGAKGGDENVVQAKNTVLVLPKLPHKPALVRLGETHTSTCRPHRETNLHVDYRLPAVTYRGRQPEPGQLSGFTPSINLPMKPVYLNPFPSFIDQYDTRFQEPILITLKSAQKYFIHNQSFIPTEPPMGVPPAH